MRQPHDPIPETTPNWTAQARRRAPFYLAAAIILSLIAGLLAFWYLDQVRAEAVPTGGALVALADIRPGDLIRDEIIELRQVPLAVMPNDVLHDRQQALGRSALFPIAAQEIVLSRDLAGETSGLSSRLPEGRWAMLLPQGWFLAPLPEALPGDRLDLLAYQAGQPADQARVLAEGVELLDSVDPDTSLQLLIAVSMEQARALQYARANGFSLLALLRSRGDR